MQNMSKHSWYGALVLVITLCWAAPMPVHALPFTPAVEYVSSQTLTNPAPFTLGYQFTTSVPFNVNALAYWVDGRGNNHQVGLWDSEGTLLVSTTVLNTDPIQDHFQYHSIPTYTLPAGDYKIGGEYLGNSDPYPYLAQGVVTVADFTWTGAVFTPGAGLNVPVSSQGTVLGQNGYLSADFSITSAAAVPEPSTLILLGAGILGLAAWRRKHTA